MKLYLDLETYSDIPIKRGTHAYAERAEILLVAYAIDEGEVIVWDVTDPNEQDVGMYFYEAIGRSDIEVVAHNSHFDRTIFKKSHHNLCPPVEQWRDTMVRALSHSLPGGLEKLCDIFKLPQDLAKNKDGKKLIYMFCVPQPENRKLRRLTRETNPVEWARFIDYARLDIEAMRALDKVLPTFNYNSEVGDLEQWFLDQKINDRGWLADVELARAALRQVSRTQAAKRKRTKELTYGLVDSPLKRDRLLRYLLAAFNIDIPDMRASTLEKILGDENLPWELRELLAVRLQASTTSTAKYRALLNSVSSDNRLRNTLKFCGASRTGRWSGQLFQPQNLPRPDMASDEIEAGIDALKNDCADMIVDDPMRLMSNACRGAIIAGPGKKLVVSDLSNIEGRAQAYLTGEDWKLEAFRKFDAGKGPDTYIMAFSNMFGIAPEDVDEEGRQKGKVSELALGYQGGVGAFVTFALVYGIDLDDMAAKITWPASYNIELDKALARAIKDDRTYFLPKKTWLACDYLKRKWREAHPHINDFWGELDDLVRFAINTPNHTFATQNGKIKIRRDKNWLRIILPSSRSLSYASPHIHEGKIAYWGANQYTREWERILTYGGKIFENICQGFARDIMAYNMPEIEADGYEILITSHDEVVTEAPNDPLYSAADLSFMLAKNKPWSKDMPLAAKGFESQRYRKGK